MRKVLALLALLLGSTAQAADVVVQGLTEATTPLTANDTFWAGQTLGGKAVTRQIHLRDILGAMVTVTPGAPVAANRVYSGPSTGAPAGATFRALVGADLPTPTASTLGAAYASTVAAKRYVTGLTTAGTLSSAQPAASDLTNGVTGSGSVVLATGPTLQTSYSVAGASSGSVTVQAQAAAGSPVHTLPSLTGTYAIGASTPLTLNATTGNLTCLTCATTTNGGSLSAVSPVQVSAGGAFSLSMGANTVLANNTGGTASPTPLTVSQTTAMLGVTANPGGRLSLTTATPVVTATVSGATTIYYTPYKHGFVPIYDGGNFVLTAFTELSNISTNSATGNAGPAAVGASKCNDFFVWSNAGVVTLTRSIDWTSTSARNMSLVRVGGRLLNGSSITNGPTAQRGTYVGTACSNSGSTWDYILGGSASGGTAANLQVWNNDNRVRTAVLVTDSGVSYTYSSATIRQWRATAGNQVGFVLGLVEDAVEAGVTCEMGTTNVAAALGRCGWGIDTTSGFSIQPVIITDPTTTGGIASGGTSRAAFMTTLGVHTIAGTEQADGSNNATMDRNSTNSISVSIWN